MSDPFACFEDDTPNEKSDEQATVLRSQDCGVLHWHDSTEQSLLSHVQNSVRDNESENTPEAVLAAIDQYCFERHWMMHVGPDKGAIVTKSLKQAIDDSADDSVTSFVGVELGTYCGYSAIMMAYIMQRAFEGKNVDYHWFSVEINPKSAEIAKEMIRMAGLSHVVSVIVASFGLDGSTIDLEGLLTTTIKSKLKFKGDDDKAPKIDFLFIDHDKKMYKRDLQRLEACGMIQQGSYVVADNVLFHRIDDYRDYVYQLAVKQVVETRLVEATLEYYQPEIAHFGDDVLSKFRDGIEITRYLKDSK